MPIDRRQATQFPKFAGMALSGFVISTIALGVLTQMTPPLAAKILTLPITYCWNYCISRFWVFRTAKARAGNAINFGIPLGWNSACLPLETVALRRLLR